GAWAIGWTTAMRKVMGAPFGRILTARLRRCTRPVKPAIADQQVLAPRPPPGISKVNGRSVSASDPAAMICLLIVGQREVPRRNRFKYWPSRCARFNLRLPAHTQQTARYRTAWASLVTQSHCMRAFLHDARQSNLSPR